MPKNNQTVTVGHVTKPTNVTWRKSPDIVSFMCKPDEKHEKIWKCVKSHTEWPSKWRAMTSSCKRKWDPAKHFMPVSMTWSVSSSRSEPAGKTSDKRPVGSGTVWTATVHFLSVVYLFLFLQEWHYRESISKSENTLHYITHCILFCLICCLSWSYFLMNTIHALLCNVSPHSYITWPKHGLPDTFNKHSFCLGHSAGVLVPDLVISLWG